MKYIHRQILGQGPQTVTDQGPRVPQTDMEKTLPSTFSELVLQMDTVSVLMLCLNNTVDVDTAQTRLQGELDASDLLEKHGWLLPSVKICGFFCSTLSSVCLSVSRVLSLLSPVKVRTGLVSHSVDQKHHF